MKENKIDKNGNRKIAKAIIHRLPKYRRVLSEMLAKGKERTSSNELGRILEFTPSQIRQDLHNFGEFGHQGYGYNVRDLFDNIGKILGLDEHYNLVMIGAGNLCQAICKALDKTNKSYGATAFSVEAIFDIDPNVIGRDIAGLTVRDMETLVDYLSDNKVDIGVITANAENPQEIVDTLTDSGVRGIWSFAAEDVETPDTVALIDVHLRESLLELAYYTKQKQNRQK